MNSERTSDGFPVEQPPNPDCPRCCGRGFYKPYAHVGIASNYTCDCAEVLTAPAHDSGATVTSDEKSAAIANLIAALADRTTERDEARAENEQMRERIAALGYVAQLEPVCGEVCSEVSPDNGEPLIGCELCGYNIVRGSVEAHNALASHAAIGRLVEKLANADTGIVGISITHLGDHFCVENPGSEHEAPTLLEALRLMAEARLEKENGDE